MMPRRGGGDLGRPVMVMSLNNPDKWAFYRVLTLRSTKHAVAQATRLPCPLSSTKYTRTVNFKRGTTIGCVD